MTATDRSEPFEAISPYQELVSYERLWAEHGSSFKKLAEALSKRDKLPSQVVTQPDLLGESPVEAAIKQMIAERQGLFSIILKESPQYPDQLLQAKYPIDLLYFRGNLDIARQKLVSVVGTRKLSEDGKRRTTKVVTLLAKAGYGIVSGLAAGTDTVALETALDVGTRVVGVIGTPIDQYYPKENKALQDRIAQEHLLLSQVPFYKYSVEPFTTKKIYFVERNATMAALSLATVIVEAGETSGTLTQARACIEQGRPLFILNSCFENPALTWPKKYQKQGAIRVRDIDDILTELEKRTPAHAKDSVDQV